jgi:hypothetical protein
MAADPGQLWLPRIGLKGHDEAVERKAKALADFEPETEHPEQGQKVQPQERAHLAQLADGQQQVGHRGETCIIHKMKKHALKKGK